MGRAERLSLYIGLTAITALAIDGVLPAMPMIEAAFPPSQLFTGAQIVTTFVLGMAIGELVIGPFSDAVGRRPAVFLGLMIFAIGTVVSATADTLPSVIIGLFIQGVGVAGPKIGTRAMVRDRYAGSDMAKVMSIIFTLLILVPMIAPTIGARVATVAGWRGVFWAYLALAVGLGTWTWARHPETLAIERRIPLEPRQLVRNIKMVARRLDVMPAVIATGFIFGAQLTYFAVAADIFSAAYGLPEMMPALFAVLATGTGAALLLNVRLVGRTGMEVLIFCGLLLLGVSGIALLTAAALTDGFPPMVALITLAWFGFFALGLLFGNLNAFAMRPLGDLAGLGSSIIASVSSLVAFVFASGVVSLTEGPVWAVAWAFILAALLSAGLISLAIPDESCKRLLHIIRIGR